MAIRPAQIYTGSVWEDIGDKRVGVQEINTQTANYTLALTDVAKRVQMNNSAARTITIPLNSSVNFPVGTRIDIANINTGVLTVAAASGATVNGRALTLGQWETATLVQRAANTWVLEQHANLTAALGSKADKAAGYQLAETVYFTSNGTFTKATYPWLRAIKVYVAGGGGGGGGAATNAAGSGSAGKGGGGGATAVKFFDDTAVGSLSASVTVTVGTGGAGGAAGNNNGSAGGQSAFGTTTANGGGGGNGGASTTPVKAGALSNGGGSSTTSNADVTFPGSPSVYGVILSANTVGNGGTGGSTGGDSFLGSGGSPGAAAVSGSAGVLGGGGGAGYAGSGEPAIAGLAGGAGIVIVELYA